MSRAPLRPLDAGKQAFAIKLFDAEKIDLRRIRDPIQVEMIEHTET